MLVNILSFKKTMETELKNISGGAEPTYFEETENLEIYIDGIRWYTYKQLSALLDTFQFNSHLFEPLINMAWDFNVVKHFI